MHLIAAGTSENSTGIFPVIFLGKPDTNSENCIACGSCYEVCPDTAIEVYELEGDDK